IPWRGRGRGWGRGRSRWRTRDRRRRCRRSASSSTPSSGSSSSSSSSPTPSSRCTFSTASCPGRAAADSAAAASAAAVSAAAADGGGAGAAGAGGEPMGWLARGGRARGGARARLAGAMGGAGARTGGEIVVSTAPFFFGDASAAARRAFARLRVAATRERNGVLVFLQPSRRRFVILGDDAVHARVGQAYWDALAARVCDRVRGADLTAAVVDIVADVGRALAQHFPATGPKENQLPDVPDV